MKPNFVFNFVVHFLFVVLCSMSLMGCAYKLSNKVDKLPGGIRVIQVPLFANETQEPHIEVIFTEALKSEVLRFGQINLVNNESEAQGILSGSITALELRSDESVIESKNTPYLPYGTILPNQVKVTVTVLIKLTERKTQKILWSNSYTQAKTYTPPQINLPVINSANNLYNLSERRQTLETLSKDMMQLAFDRLVDNF